MTPEQINASKEIIRDALKAQTQAYIEVATERKVDEIKLLESKEDTRRYLLALQPVLSDDDYLALRSALFLRARFQRGEEVRELKGQMLAQFGQRGAVIANLCTAGLFDKVLLELARAKKRKGFSRIKYRERLNLFIEQSGFSVFVKQTVNDDLLRRIVLEKILSNAVHDVFEVGIFGLGPENVARIKEVVDSISDEFDGLDESSLIDREDEAHIVLKIPKGILSEMKARLLGDDE